MTRCINLIHSLTFREYPKDDPGYISDDIITKQCGKHTLYPCSVQHWPLRTDIFTLTYLASGYPPNLCESFEQVAKMLEKQSESPGTQQGHGLLQGAIRVVSLVLSHPTWDNDITRGYTEAQKC